MDRLIKQLGFEEMPEITGLEVQQTLKQKCANGRLNRWNVEIGEWSSRRHSHDAFKQMLEGGTDTREMENDEVILLFRIRMISLHLSRYCFIWLYIARLINFHETSRMLIGRRSLRGGYLEKKDVLLVLLQKLKNHGQFTGYWFLRKVDMRWKYHVWLEF